MSVKARNAILKAKIDGEIQEILVKTTAANVYVDDSTTLDTALGNKQDNLTFDGTYNATSNKAATVKTVTDKIAALDKADTAVSGQYVSAVSETDGVITVTRATLPTAPAYSIVKDSNSGDYAAVYHLTKDGTNTGAAINIPKDMVVQSGEVVTNPTGQTAGTYIKLVLQNVTDPLYINVGSLIEYVTSGSAATDMVVVAVDGTTHKVTATITDGTITNAKLDSTLQTAIGKAHSHSNSSVLDGITSTKVTNWDNAATNNHTHSNKSVLDGITSTKVTNWDTAYTNNHTHSNKSVLDGITSAKVSAWDGKGTIYYSDTEPAALTAGDLWFQLVE